jgi:hypothetical protein
MKRDQDFGPMLQCCMVEHMDGREWDDLSDGAQERVSAVAGDFAEMLGHAAKPRVFYARVSLMGHRTIGICRVTEAPLAGVTMLRCEKDGGVEWVSPAAVYSVTEVPDAVAEAEIASALRHAQEVQAEAERRAAQLRSERAAATACVVVHAESKMVGAIASKAGLLRLSDTALQAALVDNGLDGFSLSPLDNDAHDPIGFSFYTTAVDADAERLVDAMRDLGFSSVNVRPAVDEDELVESIPF